MPKNVKLDEVGYWSEVKLDIIQKYATAYSIIMNKQPSIRKYLYIDGFAGAGVHISKTTGKQIPGSPAIALDVKPPFNDYHFIDLHSGKIELLKDLSKNHSNVEVHEGDCNEILLSKIFPETKYEDYRRALCLLDPYGLHLNWEVMRTAGQMKSIEIFLNFPVMDMNMNVLWNNPDKVSDDQIVRMDAFWGDRSWQDAAYVQTPGLFDTLEEKTGNTEIANAFLDRLKKVAGFQYVAKPLAMRNSMGATVYYLFFASQNKTGAKIVQEIFDKYKNRGLI